MKFQSARDLKDELLANVVDPFAKVAGGGGLTAMSALPPTLRSFAASTPMATGARSMRRTAAPSRSVALGIAKRGSEYQLAIRVQRQSLLRSPLVAHMLVASSGEADVRMIGRIDKRRRRAAASAAVWHQSRLRPVLIGGSIGHVDVTAGTVGGFVRRNGRVYVLSNNHVLADEDRAAKGDGIVQQGRLDGGRDKADRVATFSRAVRLSTSRANLVDAALGRLTIDEDEIDVTLLRGISNGKDRHLAGTTDEIDEGGRVFKVGRTTGATAGRVTAFNVDNVVVSYDTGNLRFDDQIEIESAGDVPFSDGGDSGSLIVDREMRAVALLFAGGETGGAHDLGLTYANPIGTVLAKLAAELVF